VNLSHCFLLGSLQLAAGYLLQLLVGRFKPLFRVLALSHGFGRRHSGRDLRCRFARSALPDHDLLWRARGRRWCCHMLAVLRSCCRRKLLRRSRRRFRGRLLYRWAFVCPRRSRDLSGCIRARWWGVLRRNRSRNLEVQPQDNRNSARQSHNGSNRIVSYHGKERKGPGNRL